MMISACVHAMYNTVGTYNLGECHLLLVRVSDSKEAGVKVCA